MIHDCYMKETLRLICVCPFHDFSSKEKARQPHFDGVDGRPRNVVLPFVVNLHVVRYLVDISACLFLVGRVYHVIELVLVPLVALVQVDGFVAASDILALGVVVNPLAVIHRAAVDLVVGVVGPVWQWGQDAAFVHDRY